MNRRTKQFINMKNSIHRWEEKLDSFELYLESNNILVECVVQDYVSTRWYLKWSFSCNYSQEFEY